MELSIVLLRFQILENYSSMGSKSLTFYNHVFLRLDSLGIRPVPGDIAFWTGIPVWEGIPTQACVCKTWIPVAICVSIHLSVKLGQWSIDLISEELQLLRVESAEVKPRWGWLGKSPAWEFREQKQRVRTPKERAGPWGPGSEWSEISESSSAGVFGTACPLAMTVLDP